MYTGGHQQLDFTDRNIAWDVARRHLFDMADMARYPSEKMFYTRNGNLHSNLRLLVTSLSFNQQLDYIWGSSSNEEGLQIYKKALSTATIHERVIIRRNHFYNHISQYKPSIFVILQLWNAAFLQSYLSMTKIINLFFISGAAEGARNSRG